MYQIEFIQNSKETILNVSSPEEIVEELFKWNQVAVSDEEDIRVSKWEPQRETYLNVFFALKGDKVFQDKDNLLLYLKLGEQIEGWEQNNRNYPDLDPNRFVDYAQLFPCCYYAPHTEIETPQEIPIEQIYGDNWTFEPRGKRGNYPRYGKLMNLLSGYTKVKNQGWGEIGSTIPSVQLYHIGDGYFLSEGNHRLYLSILMNRETLLAETVEVDYESFLRDSELKLNLYPQQPVILYKGQVHLIDEDEAKNYRLVKDYFCQQSRLDIKNLLTLTC